MLTFHIQTTMDIYTHVSEAVKEETTKLLHDYIGFKAKGIQGVFNSIFCNKIPLPDQLGKRL